MSGSTIEHRVTATTVINQYAALGSAEISKQPKEIQLLRLKCVRAWKVCRKNLDLELAAAVKVSSDNARLEAKVYSIQLKAIKAGEQSGRRLASNVVASYGECEHFLEKILQKHPRLLKQVPGLALTLQKQFSQAEQFFQERWQQVDRIAVELAVQAHTCFPKRSAIVMRILEADSNQRERIGQRLLERYNKKISLDTLAIQAFSGFFKTSLFKSSKHQQAYDAAMADNKPAAVAHLIAANYFPGYKKPSFDRLIQVFSLLPCEAIPTVIKMFDAAYEGSHGSLQALPLLYPEKQQQFLQSLLFPDVQNIDTKHEFPLLKTRLLLQEAEPTHKKNNPVQALAAYQFFSGLDPQELLFIKANYKKRFNEDLLPNGRRVPLDCPEQLALYGVLSGDLLPERVAQMKLGLHHILLPKFLLGLSALTSEQRDIRLQEFKTFYGEDFRSYAKQALKRNFRAWRFHSRRADFILLDDVLASKPISDEALIFAAVDGLGTDEKVIRRVLDGKTAGEIDTLKTAYAVLTTKLFGKPQSLEKRLRRETSGEAWFDISQQLKGKPETFGLRFKAIQDAVRFEESRIKLEYLDPFSSMTKLFRHEGDAMHARLMELKKILNDPRFKALDTTQQEKIVSIHERFARRSLQAFRLVKNVWADTIAKNTVPYLVSGALLFVKLHLDPNISWYWVVAATLPTSACIFPLIKWACKGSSYGKEECFHDSALSVLDSGTRSYMRRASAFVIRYLISSSQWGTKPGVKKAIRMLQTGNDPRRIPLHLYSLAEIPSAMTENSNFLNLTMPQALPFDSDTGHLVTHGKKMPHNP